MSVIGLCGGSGSGKGAISSLLIARGIPVIDADAVYHRLTAYMSDCLIELKEAFGAEIIRDGALDRSVLRNIVFADKDSKQKRLLLNEISHRHVLRAIRSDVAGYIANGSELIFIDAPLLFESGLDRDCDRVVAVIADRNARIDRIISRDGITRRDAEARIDSQISDDELMRRADYVVINDGSLCELDAAVEKLLIYLKNGGWTKCLQ